LNLQRKKKPKREKGGFFRKGRTPTQGERKTASCTEKTKVRGKKRKKAPVGRKL